MTKLNLNYILVLHNSSEFSLISWLGAQETFLHLIIINVENYFFLQKRIYIFQLFF